MFGYKNKIDLEEFKGKTFTNIEYHDDEKITFQEENENVYRMYHRQDCCERVRVEQIRGNLSEIENEEIIEVEKGTWSNEDPFGAPFDNSDAWASYTWTAFRFKTNRTETTIWWLGESNGYYYEGVDIAQVN